MRDNPRGDWKISDIEAVCHEFGISCRPARSGGSHYKLGHPRLAAKLIIPFKRPIKPIYIKKLIAFIDEARTLT